MLAFVRA